MDVADRAELTPRVVAVGAADDRDRSASSATAFQLKRDVRRLLGAEHVVADALELHAGLERVLAGEAARRRCASPLTPIRWYMSLTLRAVGQQRVVASRLDVGGAGEQAVGALPERDPVVGRDAEVARVVAEVRPPWRSGRALGRATQSTEPLVAMFGCSRPRPAKVRREVARAVLCRQPAVLFVGAVLSCEPARGGCWSSARSCCRSCSGSSPSTRTCSSGCSSGR